MAIHTYYDDVLRNDSRRGLGVLARQFARQLKVHWCVARVRGQGRPGGIADGSDHGNCGAWCCHGTRHGGGGSFQY